MKYTPDDSDNSRIIEQMLKMKEEYSHFRKPGMKKPGTSRKNLLVGLIDGSLPHWWNVMISLK